MSILKKPLITEKSTKMGEKLNQFGFIVDKTATKPQIKKAVEKMYEVNVINISTAVYGGKSKARLTKLGYFAGKRASFKKAFVTLKDGQKIDFFANV